MTDKEKISTLIDEMIKEAQEEPQWKAESALRCLKKELLEEQEPVMPELRMTRHGFKQWVVCGNCYGKIDGGDDYCRHCGRAVKWNA